MYIVALRVEVLVYLIWLTKCRDTQRVSDSGKIHVHLLPAASWLSCCPDWQLWSAWHSPLLPLIFYLTCLLCINMEEPQKKPERETESKPATATAPALSHSQGNSFICVASSAVAVAVGASLALCHCCTSLIMRAALGECDARIAGEQNGWAQATGKRHGTGTSTSNVPVIVIICGMIKL